MEDKSGLLPEEEILLLKACMLLPFRLGEFTSIDDILTTLHVKVIIEPRELYAQEEKVIMLFPNNMKDEYGGQKMKELLVSTLAHEAMHAYFDRQGHDRFPYVIRVEEPLAEFEMLLYLHETKQRHYLHWARNDVRSKHTCYRYGDALMSLHLDTTDNNGDSLTKRDLERYKRPLF